MSLPHDVLEASWRQACTEMCCDGAQKDGEDFVDLKEEIPEVIKDSSWECIPERIMSRLFGSQGLLGVCEEYDKWTRHSSWKVRW